MNGANLVPVHKPQVSSGADLSNFIADMLSHQRRLRVIEDNTFLVIKPACALVNLSDNDINSKSRDAICQRAVSRIECLSLPAKHVDQRRNVSAERCTGSDNGCAAPLAIRYLPGRTARKEIVKLLLRESQELRRSVCHAWNLLDVPLSRGRIATQWKL